MATKADKKRAQELAEKALQEYLKAKTEQEQRQWAETHLPLLDEAISLVPENDSAWNNWGFAKNTLGDIHGAIADFTRSIELNAKNDTAWNNRGFAKYHLGQNEEAITDYKEAIRLNPKNKTVISNLQAAEIALISHKKADETFKDEEEHHERLEERAEEHKQNYDALIKERKSLFNWIRWIIIAFIAVFVVFFLFYVLVAEIPTFAMP